LIPLFHLKAWKKLLVSGAIALVFYNLLRFSDSFYMIKQRSLDYLQAPTWEHLTSASQVFFGWLNDYLTWTLIVVWLLALIIAAKFREQKIAILSLFVLAPFLMLALIGKVVYPRYLLPTVPFILIISAWGLIRLPKTITRGIVAIILVLWLRFDYYLLTNPVQAPLPHSEKEQYFYTWAAGSGLKEIRQYLNQLPQDKKIVVATEGSFGTLPNGLEIYFSGHPTIQILGVGFPAGGISGGMEQALQDNQRVFLVANFNRFSFPNPDRLWLIKEYPRPGGEKLMFYEVL
jgi:hypothetical protein